MKPHPYLSADALLGLLYEHFETIQDHRPKNVTIPLADALMSAFAMFSLKEPSLLAFDDRRRQDENLKQIYGIEHIPSDTQMRTILDEVNPTDIRPLFKAVFNQLKQAGVVEQLVFMKGHYLLSVDGTGYFSSKEIHCDSCLKRVAPKTGEVTYSHQLLGAALVHPDQKVVIPFAPEPIIKQDGSTKNDCERNAAKRFFDQLRRDHPDLPLIVIEDALSANAPHIRELKRHQLRYIIGVKPGDHAFLFDFVQKAEEKGQVSTFEVKPNGTLHRFRFLNDVPLNASNPDLRVNFLEYWEVGKKKTRHFTWITDFTITTANVYQLMRGGRARWKIENETFNTLKNQGYHFEHNFGHGHRHLSTVFALLMMLAFALDQAQQLACQLFQAARNQVRSQRAFWEKIRALFDVLDLQSMTDILRAIAFGYSVKVTIFDDTS